MSGNVCAPSGRAISLDAVSPRPFFLHRFLCLSRGMERNVRRVAKTPDGKRRRRCQVIQRCAQQCGQIIAANSRVHAEEI